MSCRVLFRSLKASRGPQVSRKQGLFFPKNCAQSPQFLPTQFILHPYGSNVVLVGETCLTSCTLIMMKVPTMMMTMMAIVIATSAAAMVVVVVGDQSHNHEPLTTYLCFSFCYVSTQERDGKITKAGKVLYLDSRIGRIAQRISALP